MLIKDLGSQYIERLKLRDAWYMIKYQKSSDINQKAYFKEEV